MNQCPILRKDKQRRLDCNKIIKGNTTRSLKVTWLELRRQYLGLVVPVLNPLTQHSRYRDRQTYVSSKLIWSTQWIPGQQQLYKEITFQSSQEADCPTEGTIPIAVENSPFLPCLPVWILCTHLYVGCTGTWSFCFCCSMFALQWQAASSWSITRDKETVSFEKTFEKTLGCRCKSKRNHMGSLKKDMRFVYCYHLDWV